MNIHEYQGKQLFKLHGLPVQNGIHCKSIEEAKNAGILAAQIIGISDSEITKKLVDYKSQLEKKVYDSEKNL